MDMPDYIELRHSNPTHKDVYVVNWCLGNTCNYTCSYCTPDLNNGSKKWPEFETVRRFCDYLFQTMPEKKFYFEFTGGEVTLWKDLPILCDYLKAHNADIGIISNGSRSFAYWEKLIPKIDHICLSFHVESAKIDHVVEVVKMCSPKIRTHVNVMMSPTRFNECVQFANKVIQVPDISIAIQPLIIDFKTRLYDYTKAQLDVINRQAELFVHKIKKTKEQTYYRGAMKILMSDGEEKVIAPQRFISQNKNSWRGWECSAGKEQIVVDFDGKIYRGWCKVDGDLGSIHDKNLKLDHSTTICSKSHCHCNFDIMSTKRKVKDVQRAAEL